MKYLMVCFALLCGSSLFSQSKKKQIENLQHQLDSITRVNQTLNFFRFEEEKLAQNTIAELEKENALLRKIMLGHIHTIDELNSLNTSLENQLKDSFNVVNVKLVPEDQMVQSGLVNDAPFGDEFITRNCFPAKQVEAEAHSGKGRTRLNRVNIDDIEIKEDASICYKLTIDENGSVVDFIVYRSKTTTNDQTLIDLIGNRIKKEVKYNRFPSSFRVNQDYTIVLKAN